MPMRLLFATAALLASSALAAADVRVVASIKPIHSLVAQVMEGVGTPGLIVDGSNSPHTFSLKPSNAQELEQAQVIFWVGHELEPFLEKPLEALGEKAKVVGLMDASGMKKLPLREDVNFEAHDHGHEEGEGESHDHDHDHDHDHGKEEDPHVWLDPDNAKAMVKAIATTLAEADPAHAKRYAENADKALARLDALSADIATAVAPAKGKGFIVFHDAYQYFEARFGVEASGAIAIHPENPPGAEAISAMRKRLADGKVACVFSEPQFDNKLVNVILEGTAVRAATLDPLGADVEPGPALYDSILRKLASSLTDCL